MTFGARLTQARKDKKLTQEQLGKRLGTEGKDAGKAVVSGWEKDQHHPRADQLAQICERLGCSADFLLFGKVDQSGLRPDVAGMAAEVNALPEIQRNAVMAVIRQSIALAVQSLGVTADAVPHHTQVDVEQPAASVERVRFR